MGKRIKLAGLIALILGMVALFAKLLHGHTIAVLDPKGPVARQELNLIIFATIIMLIVVIPVFALTIGIAWRYRATNTKARYTPDWDRNRFLEFTWWAIPCAIIAVLSVLAWTSSHALDPFKPLVSSRPQMTIQVVSLDWKWLFIYPNQDIATVNFVEFPQGTPIDFEITSDAPMNSFWIPQLGGQIYAMPGMSTQLHLMADGAGSYNGSSANISGVGFSGMRFVAKSTSQSDFKNWVHNTQKSSKSLTQSEYYSLAKPSEYNSVAVYSSVEPYLYDDIIMKFMMPQTQVSSTAENSRPAPILQSQTSSMAGMDMK